MMEASKVNMRTRHIPAGKTIFDKLGNVVDGGFMAFTKHIVIKMPYCGACGKSIDDAGHKFCGWCGVSIDWNREGAD